MPRVKFDYIVSFSNEDPEHPASNLLSWEVGKRRWLCRAGEPTCSVVLQLTRAVQISAVHIGSYHAAVVEVLVGRSETPDQFEVLVPSSVFLSPSESRREPVDRVRSFSGEQLSAAASQRWDRVRAVCRQPYNKQSKYGLSFIQVYEPESASNAAPSAPIPAARAIAASTNFGNSSSDEEDYRPGQLFAAARQSGGTSTETQIRQATSQILKNISDTSTKIVKSPIVKNTTSTSKQNVNDETSLNRHRDSLMYTGDEEQPHSKIDSVVQRHQDEKAKEKDARDAKEKSLKEKKDRDHSKQSESNDSKAKRDDQRARKDNYRATGMDSAKKDDRGKRDDNNTSRNDRDKKRDSRRDDYKNKDDHRAKRDDRSNDRPGRSDDRGDSRNRGNNTPSNKDRHGRDDQQRTATKRSRPSNSTDGSPRAGPVSSSPHSLLSDVALVLSGYVHPRRGQVRAAATALGARVLHDWGPTATHLICAFPNTPKLRQALASNPATPVATAEWVEQCCALRRRLPWQWFATEPAKRLPAPDLSALPDRDTDHAAHDEEGDTDDEIEKVLREQKKRRRSSTPDTPADDTKKDDSTDEVEFVKDERIKGRMTIHDSDSDADKTIDAPRSGDEGKGSRDDSTTKMDVDSDGDVTEPEPDRASSPGRTHSPLPNFFDGHTFYIEPEVAAAGMDAGLLARYVRAYGGVLVQDWSDDDSPVDFVLCASDEQCQTRGRHVRADWLWRCHAERRLCSPDRYLVRPADT